MREVIRFNIKKSNDIEKPIELTHMQYEDGWREDTILNHGSTLVHIGRCAMDGDMFAEFTTDGDINIYKGHLNSGKY